MNADMNPRGGLTVDRDSLHASPGYARQVEAAKQLQERRVNADVEKAVAVIRTALNDWTATYASEFCDEDAAAAARKRISDEGTLGYICNAQGTVDKLCQALRDQEAQIARLRDVVMRKEGELSTAWIRAALGDALLQEAHPFVPVTYSSSGRPQLHDRITAHLGGEQ